MVFLIFRKDCLALASNKDKFRVCSVLLQTLQEGFRQNRGASLLRVDHAMEGYQPTAQARPPSSSCQVLGLHVRDRVCSCSPRIKYNSPAYCHSRIIMKPKNNLNNTDNEGNTKLEDARASAVQPQSPHLRLGLIDTAC